MTRAVAILTCVLCATMTAGLFAEQQDSTWQDRAAWQDQRDTGQSGYSGQSGQGQQGWGYRERDSGTYGQQQWRDDRGAGMRGQQYGRGAHDQQTWGYRDQDSGARGQQWQDDRGMGMRGQQYREGGVDQQYWDMRDRGQSDRGMGMRGQRFGGQGRLMVVGQITNDKADVPGVNPSHQVAQIRTREGTTLFVDLGPREQIQDLNLSQNQSIFVQGHLANLGGQRVIMAQRVGKVSQLTQINRGQEDQTYGFRGGRQQDQSRQPDWFRRQQDQSGQQGQSDQYRDQHQRQDSSDIYGYQDDQIKKQSGQLPGKDQSGQMKDQSGQSGSGGQSDISNQSGISDESKSKSGTDSTNR
ncbi:MAG TPA: hypothetical protein PLV57_09650 [Phycisphaerae bacterium]|nr:hypothetical protein [Phycisphaerae bacterium]HOM51261.1 hypothetical protein [Phycisphaerae bacterium]HPP26774.1 hypothetical protein [Phycisphaerae bacterium]